MPDPTLPFVVLDPTCLTETDAETLVHEVADMTAIPSERNPKFHADFQSAYWDAIRRIGHARDVMTAQNILWAEITR